MSATTDHKPTPAPATDWRQPIRFAALRIMAVLALVMTATIAGVILWQFGTGTVAIVAAAVVVVVGGIFTGVLWMLTTHGIRATWQIQPKAGRPGAPRQPVTRLMPITGGGRTTYVDLPPLDDDPATPMVEGWGLTQGDLAAFLAETWSRGWSVRSWINDPFILPESQRQVTRQVLEDLRQAAIRHGLLTEQGQTWGYKPGLTQGRVFKWLNGLEL